MSWREKYEAVAAGLRRNIRIAFPPPPEVRMQELRDDIAEMLLTSNPDQTREWALEMATNVWVVLWDHAPLHIRREQ